MIILALAFASIILLGSLMVLVNDLVAAGVRRLRTAEDRPARRRQRRHRTRMLT
jgi:hypothetical protein